MEQYSVTGMSCAACSARVEKAVSNVPGVTSCSVSLLTNSMGVEGTASAQDIISAVQNAGYGASVKGAGKENTASGMDDDLLKDKETVLVPDGISIVKAAKSIGYNIKERITGIDIATTLLSYGNELKKKITSLF